ncbi:unnamed protein product [Rotaria sp. Silwood2]|nr:unnamed protein product [Rotaria sp. Silwood2]CAF3063175.1 unnamed protein product [Rotaria sp. Silwood2]CAF3357152.1 unnamed protein product [Rotaria sp. Silwood2]CAF3450030.1 unnamed protein product [Rotaria sp. Silwood2]CAF4039210.1 unnamed protein product [Rotaria sp. Silwood2]
MSSSTLTAIQNQLSLYGNAIFAVVGNIGNVFIILIFGRQHTTACSIYLISSAVVNFIFLTVNGYFQIFPFNYSGGTNGSIIFCKVSAYILNVLGQLSKTILIFACMDRFLITSERASIRAFTTIKRAKYLILLSFIFWSLFTLHVPIMRTVTNGRCGASGIYSTIFAFLFVSLFPIIIAAIFGHLTYQNMRQMQIRVHPTVQNTNNFLQRRDRDLLTIVTAEIITYVVTTTLYPVILLETIISQNVVSNKSVLYSQIEGFILSIAYLLLFSNSAAPFYTYFIASKSFRRDFKKLIVNIYHKITRQKPVENNTTITRALTQQETRV